MAICAPNLCALPVPEPVNDCCGPSERRTGGISRIVFASCDVALDQPLSLNQIEQLVGEGKIRVTGEVTGQKAKSSYQNRRISSCAPEQVVGIEHSLSFQDFNADQTGFADHDFYTQLQRYPSRYQFGWLSCEGLFYGLVERFSIEADYIIEETNTGLSFWDINLKWQGMSLPKPVFVNGLLDVLNSGCQGAGNGSGSGSGSGSGPSGWGEFVVHDPEPQEVVAGNTISVPTSIARMGCEESVYFGTAVLPTGVSNGTFSFIPPGSYAGSYQLIVAPDATPGSYEITVYAMGCGQVKPMTIQLTVLAA